jgi:hypothetical protein
MQSVIFVAVSCRLDMTALRSFLANPQLIFVQKRCWR